MRVLVTNDDGVASPGLLALARAIVRGGHDVVVAAPLYDASGTSAAIGPVHLGTEIAVEERALEDDELPMVVGVDGPPALVVILASLGAFGPEPEVVASGINPGCNTGRSVSHSGTVGAALTAAGFGMRGVAVSIDVGDELRWDTAAALGARAVDWLAGADVGTVLNVNVPNVEPSAVRGVRRARLAPFGTVRTSVVRSGGGNVQVELRETDAQLDADTDTALVRAGYATVTPLVGPRAAPGVDVSDLTSEPVGEPG